MMDGSAIQGLIGTHRTELVELCRRFHVQRLDVFGSAAREDFYPARSDLDFVVEFEREHPLGGLEAYFGLKEALEALFARKVDLVSEGAVQNPYLRRSINESRETVYAA
jgi:predicted nucleotidyltransferase